MTTDQLGIEADQSGSSITPDLRGYRQNNNVSLSGDGRNHPRHKPTPSPLQVSESSSTMSASESISPKSPTALRTISRSQYSPRSPLSNPVTHQVQPNPPREGREMLDQLVLADTVTTSTGDTGNIESRMSRQTPGSPMKAHSYSQLQDISSPLPQATRSLDNSSPPSPRSIASPPLFGSATRAEARTMPRTSSIDSSISNISLGTKQQSYKTSLDTSGTPDISNLIRTAGSAEAVIQHLLKEKQHLAAQNAQLWKLVDKQRSLVLGLNQDLERALKDKEKYRKRLREHLDKVPPTPGKAHKASATQPRDFSHSPAPSEASTDLPFQRSILGRTATLEVEEAGSPTHALPTTKDRHNAKEASSTIPAAEEAGDWVRSKPRTGGANHSHKATSSSDVGVFGSTRPTRTLTPIKTDNVGSSAENDGIGSPSQGSHAARPVASPTNSFTAKRSQLPFSTKAFSTPSIALTASTPPGNDLDRMTPPRKPPPAPLDLAQPKRDDLGSHHYGPEDHSGSDYDGSSEENELPASQRGRKPTREEDDRERETALFEKQDRSRSKKEKTSKPPSDTTKPNLTKSERSTQPQDMPIPSSVKALAPEPTPAGVHAYLSPPTSLASVLTPSDTGKEAGTTQHTVSAKPMSPGLPLSPRPNHRPVNPPTPRMPREGTGKSLASPPLSPRSGFAGLPLSPRAPRQPIPLPPHTPMSLASPVLPDFETRKDSFGSADASKGPVKTSADSLHGQIEPEPESPEGQSVESTTRSRGIFRGFVSDAHPDLLIPPNALPSIFVKVISSRLKPSRHSLVLKGADEEPVFTLGVSARSHRQELWQVEKPILSLQQLDHQLRLSSTLDVRLPDRSLFSGHAPARIDARRVALERYFETILDTQMDERAAHVLCQFLSTQATEPTDEEASGVISASHSGSPISQGSDGRCMKQGYLTKRGKNFGGWKARFFVLQEAILRYHETPGGSVLGTIKLQSAQIGKQAPNRISHSPSRGGDDGDGQYRHAFLIREPKRKDSGTFIDHILCAESDAERDSWVAALLFHVDEPPVDDRSRPSLISDDSGSSRPIPSLAKSSLKNDTNNSNSPDSGSCDSLQAVPYEDTKPAQAPHVRVMPDPRPIESPSPTTSGTQPSLRALSQSKAISAPSNGVKISDVGAWGNKPMTVAVGNQKEHKKRSIWGFRDRNQPDIGINHSNDSTLSLTQQQYQEQITNVKAAFGAPLAEAVEFCGPHGIDICLPAVVYRCLEYLEDKNAASEEGIFRMSGSNVVIKGLKNRFNAEGDFDFLAPDEQYFDVHAVASLLKLYLRELPQPVLTRELHLEFLGVLGKRHTRSLFDANSHPRSLQQI